MLRHSRWTELTRIPLYTHSHATDLEATNGVLTAGILADYGLKLSLSITYAWLLLFYFYFHLYLNLFAELLRFGDRVFYKDWWNVSFYANPGALCWYFNISPNSSTPFAPASLRRFLLTGDFGRSQTHYLCTDTNLLFATLG